MAISGLDARAREEHERQARELGLRPLAVAAGASAARNRALEEVDGDQVVAFLDDDVMPAPDWLERLAARWDAAGDDVACIGGAIVPRWLESPPAWLGAGLWPSYALLDLGPGLIEMNPEGGADVWGANLSLRAGHALKAGGFPTDLGPRPGAPLIGEETALERELSRAGRRVLYAGDVRVEHLIGPERLRLRWLLRRELYRGVTAARYGWRTPAEGAPRALKAAGGAGLAALRGDRALSAERLCRAALNLGAATAPLRRSNDAG